MAEPIMPELAAKCEQLRILAALAAALRVKAGEAAVPQPVAERLDEVVAAHLMGAKDVSPGEATTALRFVRAQLEGALETFRNPGRTSWTVEDSQTLIAVGDASREFVRFLDAHAATRPALKAAFQGRLLDVGVGVAGLTLEAASTWPDIRIVGLEILPLARDLARKRVAASPDAQRIEIREQNVLDLDEREAYTFAWLPSPFMPKHVAEAASARLVAALRPEGYLAFAFAPKPDDPRAASIAALFHTRNGGYAWTPPEVETLFLGAGLAEVETLRPTPAVVVTLGRKTAG
jgi:SAM-dependent methyltransferase